MEKEFYIRKASGLTREISPLETWFYTMGPISIGATVAAVYVWVSFAYPGADMVQALLISAVPALLFAVMYWCFTISMPRSGGDYVFCSRVIHPAAGFVTNFVWSAMWLFDLGMLSNLLSVYFISDALATYGHVSGNESLLGYATWAASPVGGFVVGTVALIFTCLVLIAGSKIAVRVIAACVIVGLLGVFIAIGAFAFSSNQAFISAFNRVATGGATYNSVIETAKGLGATIVAPSLAASIACLPYVYNFFLGHIFASYVAGEIREIKKSIPLAMIGGSLTMMAIIIVSLYAYFGSVGYEFNSAIAYLFYMSPDKYPLPSPPEFQYFAALLVPQPLAVIIAFSFIPWGIALIVPVFMMISRNIFAWSFDRIVPTKLSEIHPRFKTPALLTVVLGIIGEITLAMFCFKPELYFVFINILLGGIYSGAIIPALAGILFPLRRKDIYEKSPIAKWKIGPIPVISLAGLVSFVWFPYIVYLSFASISPENLPSSIAALAGIWILGLVAYYAARAYWKPKGIDLDLLYKEIPPE